MNIIHPKVDNYTSISGQASSDQKHRPADQKKRPADAATSG